MKYTNEMHAEDDELSPLQLDDKYNPSGSGEHPVFTRQLWRGDVFTQDTLYGYWDWVFNQIQNWEPVQDDAELEATYRIRALTLFADDECTFDDNCAVSVADDGAWVACWRWVPADTLYKE